MDDADLDLLRGLLRGQRLLSLAVVVDGAPVGRSKAFPWQVPHRFAPGSGAHTLEALIERADGGRERARIQVYSVSPDAEVAVEMVPLTVTVTNQQYFFVRTLEQKDFLVYEDGVLQDIEDFDREPTPLTVLVLADSSFSMNGRRLEMATEGVRALARALEPGDRLFAIDTDEGILLTPYDPEFAAGFAAYRRGAKKYRNALAALAR